MYSCTAQARDLLKAQSNKGWTLTYLCKSLSHICTWPVASCGVTACVKDFPPECDAFKCDSGSKMHLSQLFQCLIYLPLKKGLWILVWILQTAKTVFCFAFLFQFCSWLWHRLSYMILGYSLNLFLPQFIVTRRRLHHFPSLTSLLCQNQRLPWALIFSASWHTFSSESTIILAMVCIAVLQ